MSSDTVATPTPDEIADAAALAAATGVQSATGPDGRSATQMDPMKQLEVADAIAARTAATSGVNPWNGLRPTRIVFPGAGPG